MPFGGEVCRVRCSAIRLTRSARRGMLPDVVFTPREESMKLCRETALCAFADEASHGAGTDRLVGIGRRAA